MEKAQDIEVRILSKRVKRHGTTSIQGLSVTVHCREGGFWRVTDSQRLLLYRETPLIRLHRD